jgi:hypothetical protein
MGKTRQRKPRIPGQMKRFSQGYISTGKGPNPIVLAEYKERALTIGIDQYLWSRQIDGQWQIERFDPDRVKRDYDVNGGKNSIYLSPDDPRRLALEKRKALLEGQDPLRFIVLRRGKYIITYLFSNSQGNDVFLFQEDHKGQVFRRSIPYPNVKRAKQVLETNRVRWGEEVSFDVPKAQAG